MKRFVVSVFLMGCCGVVFADSFSTATSGVWNASSTWSPNGVPQAADDATITTHWINLSRDEQVNSLAMNGGSLNTDSYTLTVDSTFNLSAGTVEGSTLNVGTFNWTGGRINDSEVYVANGTFDSTGTLYLDNSPLWVTGTFSQGNTGIIRLYGTGSIITNQGTWQLTNDEQPFDSTGRFVNEGTFRKNGGTGTSSITVPFSDHAGTVQVDSGTVRFNRGDNVFSNTTFSVASASSAYFPNGSIFKGAIQGAGNGALSLGGEWGATFYFTNSCSLDMGEGTIRWNRGSFRDSVFSTLSTVDLVGSGAKSLIDSVWTLTGGADHTANGSFYLTRSTLNIPVGSSYDVKVDGGPLSNSTGGRINLAGTLAKTAGAGTTTINVSIYGDGATLNVSTGTLSLTGSGRLDNLSGVLQEDAKLRLGGTCSNANFAAVESGGVYLSQDATMVGDWMLTNIVFSVSGPKLYATPSLTLQGTNSKFSFSSGQLQEGIITNYIPFEVPFGSGTRYIYRCHIHSYEDADFYDTGMLFQRSSWHNYPGVTHRMNVDGDIFGAVDHSTYYNQGTFCKAAGDGTSGTKVKFVDTAGTIAVDTGTLWLSSNGNEFRNTQVTMASGTTFRMAGSVCSNMTISAAGAATVRVASDGYDQTINTDLAITGLVKVELVTGDLAMAGAITGSEASFEWRGGRIEYSHMTNAVSTIFSSTSTSRRYLINSTLTLQADVVHTNLRVAVLRSTIVNEAGSYYQLLGDAKLLWNNASGKMVNKGRFIKTGGSGTTDVDLPFLNQAGTVGATIGTLRFSSTLDLTDGGLEVALGGVTDHGTVQSTAAVTAGGALTVTLRDGYEPAVGDRFVLFSGSSLTGTFTTTNLPVLGASHFWDVTYESSELTLTAVSLDDTDGDLLPDQWEIEKLGSIHISSGGDSNHDSDSFTDYEEYIADTDPTNSASHFCVTATGTAPSMSLYFDSSSNRWYSLLGCTSLVSNVWNPVSISRMGMGGIDSLTSTNLHPIEFYKLTVELP